MAKVVMIMADYGHDPTETTVPYSHFKAAGFDVKIATEAGKSPKCDTKLLEGVTRMFLGASMSVVKQYETMTESEEWKHPLAWSSDSFTLDDFDHVFFPGGHEKAVTQVIDSARVHQLLVDYFPKTKKPSKKSVAAVCHGVMVLSAAKDQDGKSVIHSCTTTTLPAKFEQLAFWGTRAFLGDYYKAYGAGSEDAEESVRKVLDDPSQMKNSLSPAPFSHEDTCHNYITARYPADSDLMSKRIVAMIQR